MISEKDRNYLEKEFAEKLKNAVRLIVFTQEFECTFCKEARELVLEVGRLSEKLNVEVYDFQKDSDKRDLYGVDKVPAIVVMGEKDYGIRFYGIPAGYEFGSLINAIVSASKGESSLSESSKAKLELKKPVHIQVFVTPTCPYCPGAVMLAHNAALASDQVRGDMVEVTEFPHLAQKYSVTAVPKTVINDQIELTGLQPENVLIENILSVAESKFQA